MEIVNNPVKFIKDQKENIKFINYLLDESREIYDNLNSKNKEKIDRIYGKIDLPKNLIYYNDSDLLLTAMFMPSKFEAQFNIEKILFVLIMRYLNMKKLHEKKKPVTISDIISEESPVNDTLTKPIKISSLEESQPVLESKPVVESQPVLESKPVIQTQLETNKEEGKSKELSEKEEMEIMREIINNAVETVNFDNSQEPVEISIDKITNYNTLLKNDTGVITLYIKNQIKSLLEMASKEIKTVNTTENTQALRKLEDSKIDSNFITKISDVYKLTLNNNYEKKFIDTFNKLINEIKENHKGKTLKIHLPDYIVGEKYKWVISEGKKLLQNKYYLVSINGEIFDYNSIRYTSSRYQTKELIGGGKDANFSFEFLFEILDNEEQNQKYLKYKQKYFSLKRKLNL